MPPPLRSLFSARLRIAGRVFNARGLVTSENGDDAGQWGKGTAAKLSGEVQTAAFYDTAWERYADLPIRRVRVQDLLRFGRHIKNNEELLYEGARFVRSELTVRLAHRIRDLHLLPFVVGFSPHLRNIYNVYVSSFNELRKTPSVKTRKDHDIFLTKLNELVDQNKEVIPWMAAAVADLQPHMSKHDLNQFYDKMLMTRMSRRILVEHHVALAHQCHAEETNTEKDTTGILSSSCRLFEVTKTVVASVSEWSRDLYGVAPVFVIDGDEDCNFPYIPSHLQYMLMELVRNTARNVAQNFIENNKTEEALCVRITVAKGDTDVTVRVSDTAGGLSDSEAHSLWDYEAATLRDTVYEHNSNPAQDVNLGKMGLRHEASSQAQSHSNSGLGMPFTRLFSRYFGGDLDVYPMLGFGTDVVLRLKNVKEQFELIAE